MRLKSFVTDTEMFVSIIQKEAIWVHGYQMEQLLDNLEYARNIETYDFTTLYTNLDHQHKKQHLLVWSN